MNADICRQCGSQCCKYFCFEIDEPTDYEEFEDIRWYLCHENVSIHIDDGSWFISILNPCKMLDDDGQCRIYDERPLICRKYDLSGCDYTEGDYGHDAEFNTPEEVEAYARQTLGMEGFDKPRKRKRRRLEAKAAGKKTTNGKRKPKGNRKSR